MSQSKARLLEPFEVLAIYNSSKSTRDLAIIADVPVSVISAIKNNRGRYAPVITSYLEDKQYNYFAKEFGYDHADKHHKKVS